jgi:ribosomal protein S18 acetylase RimI-like enzyme
MTLTSEAVVFPIVRRIGFRLEQPEDESFLQRLYASTRAEEMALTGWSDAQKDAFLGMQFQFQTAHYRKYYADASFRIILLDEVPVGRIYLHYGPREIRLMDVALLPEARGAGIGEWILANLLREAAQMGKPITLYVERFNRALHLYERLGFQVVEDHGMNLYMQWQPVSPPQ